MITWQFSDDSDAALVLNSLKGDSHSFSELVERHGSGLLYSAYRLTGDWDEAKDIVQDALIYAYRSLGHLRNPQRFSSWVQTIVLRTYQGCIKQKKRRQKLLDYYMTTEGSDPSIATAPSSLPDQDLHQ